MHLESSRVEQKYLEVSELLQRPYCEGPGMETVTLSLPF